MSSMWCSRPIQTIGWWARNGARHRALCSSSKICYDTAKRTALQRTKFKWGRRYEIRGCSSAFTSKVDDANIGGRQGTEEVEGDKNSTRSADRSVAPRGGSTGHRPLDPFPYDRNAVIVRICRNLRQQEPTKYAFLAGLYPSKRDPLNKTLAELLIKGEME